MNTFRLALLVIICCTAAFAQINTATIVGRVLDASGAVIVGAQVTVTQQETNLTRSGATDEAGNYQFLLLPPGTYKLSVHHAGFKEESRNGIVLAAGERVRLELALTSGEVTSQVSVEAGAALVNTESSALQFVVGARQVQNLPLNGRNFSQLVALGTGVVPSRPNTVASFTLNGTSQYGINISLDGTDASFIETPTFGDPSQQSRLNTVSLDSIEQLQVQTATFSAEVTRATGGLVNIITKSGTNTFHGSLFEYFRNDKLDARNFFAATKPPLRQNQFGGTLGGPIQKDRLFFFGSYEGSRAHIGQVITSNVPTVAFRNRAPTAYQNYLNMIPVPTESIAGNNDAGIYRRNDNFRSDENLYNMRVDQVAGASSLAVRYSLNKSENSTPNLVQANRLVYPITNHLATISHTYVISSATLNEARAGWDRWDVPRHNTTYAQGLGEITISGLLTSGNTEGVLHFVDSTYSLSDTLSHRMGNHSLKAGAELRRLDSFRTQRANPRFSYTSGSAFLANTPASVIVTYGNLGTDLRQYQAGFFFQDDWRATHRLTLNLGLRYDYFSPLGEVKGRMVSTGANPFGPFQPQGTPLWAPGKNNFQPRLGFAWDVTGTQKTVVRGGFGVSSISLPPFFIWNAATIDPRLPAAATYTPTDVPGLSFPLSGSLLAAYQNPLTAVQAGLAPAVVSRFVIDPARRDPYTLTWNLTAERQLGGNLLLQASYVGTRTIHSPNARVLNLVDLTTKKRTDPTIGEIDLSENSGRRYYHGLQVAVHKRLSKGLVANANYTWSHAIVYGGEDSFGPSAVQDWSNIRGSRGTSALDLRHTFVLDYLWELPTGRLESTAVGKQIFGGWMLSGITYLRSGLPANLVTGRDNRGNGFASTQRPNYLGGDIYATQQSVESWYNKAAFANPAAGNFGNLGYDAARGPMYATVNLGLAKRFTLRKEQRLQFRAEAFNLFNRANFFNPDNNINSPTFGRITSADIPRQLQFSLRYEF